MKFRREWSYLTDLVDSKQNYSTSVAFSTSGELIVVAPHGIFLLNENYKFVKFVTDEQLTTPYCLTIARDRRMMVCDKGDHPYSQGAFL